MVCIAGHRIIVMKKYLCLFLICAACRQKTDVTPNNMGQTDTTVFAAFSDAPSPASLGDSTLADKIVAFAKTQIGVPYKYCSMTPEGGFDCSGFVNYVFDHFNVKVPRSSVEFTNIGKDVPLAQSKPGDVILFTGTNPHNRAVGHIGIIVANNNGDISFIQSTSGVAYGVVISKLDENYMARFVKVINILE
jgi:cell wall-associated NlpC family hydrolase